MTPGRKNEDFKIAWGKQKPHKLKIRDCDMHKSTLVLNWLWLSTCLTRDSRGNAQGPFLLRDTELACGSAQTHLLPFISPLLGQRLSMNLLFQRSPLFNHSHGHPKLPYGAIGRKRGLNGNPSSHKYSKICFPKINA